MEIENIQTPEPQTPEPVQTAAPTQPVQQPQPAATMQPAVSVPQMVQPTQPVQVDPQASIIEQQNAQIAALMAQNQALNQQVISMVQGGAQFPSQPVQSAQPVQPIAQPTAVYPTQIQQMQALGAQPDPLGTFNPVSLASGQDVSLEALASEIGKKG